MSFIALHTVYKLHLCRLLHNKIIMLVQQTNASESRQKQHNPTTTPRHPMLIASCDELKRDNDLKIHAHMDSASYWTSCSAPEACLLCRGYHIQQL
jgi:hypothetical protein